MYKRCLKTYFTKLVIKNLPKKVKFHAKLQKYIFSGTPCCATLFPFFGPNLTKLVINTLYLSSITIKIFLLVNVSGILGLILGLENSQNYTYTKMPYVLKMTPAEKGV